MATTRLSAARGDVACCATGLASGTPVALGGTTSGAVLATALTDVPVVVVGGGWRRREHNTIMADGRVTCRGSYLIFWVLAVAVGRVARRRRI